MRREVAQVSATLVSTVGELPDEEDGGRLRAATADDYASMQYRLAPREGSKATSSFDKTRVINVRVRFWNASYAAHLSRVLANLGICCQCSLMQSCLWARSRASAFGCSCRAQRDS